MISLARAFHLQVYIVSAVAEPGLSVTGGDGGNGVGDGLLEGIDRSSFGGAKRLFELGPALLDGIEIRRVGRQVEQFGTRGFNQLPHPENFVRTQVVHHHHVARFQPGAQHLLQVSKKNFAIRGRFYGHGCNQSFDAHRTQQSQSLPVPRRIGLPHPLTAESTPIATRHLRGHAAFIQEQQPFRVDPVQRFAPRLTTFPVLLAVLFLGIE